MAKNSNRSPARHHVAKPGEVFKNTESFIILFRVLSVSLLIVFALLIVFGIWTIISNTDNNITSWKMPPNIFYILFGAFIVVYVNIFIHTCRLKKRTKILSEAVTDTLTEKYQPYVIEVTESSDITKVNMESKCQDLQILKSSPIFPQELAIQRETSLPSCDDLMYHQNCQIQENPPPYQY